MSYRDDYRDSTTEEKCCGHSKPGSTLAIGSAAFLPWNHPLRLEAETLVQRYHDYAQTHLPTDSNRQLAQMIVSLVQAHLPKT